jgi:glycylpeptide N-tetradecanoyltransferase
MVHTFWDKQPVPRDGTGSGEIEDTRETSKKTTKLPEGFVWSPCSLKEVCTFLNAHYVGNDTFRMGYTVGNLKWSVNESVAIRKQGTGELVGYISSAPVTMNVETKVIDMVQITYLCIHTEYRTMNFAPILITEIKRRANRKGVWQAIYTAQTKIPTPITKAHYWHRFLNVKRLVQTGFHKTNRLRESYYEVRGPCKCLWRKMTLDDVPKVTQILQKHMSTFKIAPVIDETYVMTWLLPIHSYVNDETDDFISFYDVSYDRVDGTGSVKQVYKFHIVGDVYNDAFLLAKNLGYDVFNILDVGIDAESLEKLKFMKGNGFVFYYLWNWNLSERIEPKEINHIIP